MKAADLERIFAAGLPDILSMGVMMFDPVWAERTHPAHGCEVLHVIRGRVELVLGDDRYPAGPEETLLIPSGVPHRDEFDLDAGLEVFICHLDWPAEKDYFAVVDNAASLAMPPPRKGEIVNLFLQLRSDRPWDSPEDKLVARSRIHAILLLILREALRQKATAAEGPTYGQRRRQEILQQACAYLEQHYAECVALDAIASALHVSPYYLSHVFSEESDFTLFSYLTSLRMERAKALLREGQLNVSEVARAVGYGTPNYFAKVFRKHVGCAPRAYAATVQEPQ